MKKPLLAFAFAAFNLAAFAQFAPQAGIAGTTAIHKDSSVFINWATACTITRGWQNIADQNLGLAQVGDSTYVPGPAANGIVSLGDGGQAVVTFAHPIVNGNGYDFAVFENGFIDQTLKPGTAFLELAFVEVSSDGVNFFRFPAICNTDSAAQIGSFEGTDATKIHNLAGKYLANYGTPFDLNELSGIAGLDISNITHVKIIDVVGALDARYASRDSEGKRINDPWPTPFAQSGFDLDAVGVIHQNTQVGLNEVYTQHQINVYPNPAQQGGVIKITLPLAGNTALQIYDALGGLVLADKITDTSYTLPPLNNGIYYIKMVVNHQTIMRKLVVANDTP